MSRLLTLLRWEATIQFRLGIFYAAAAVAAMWALILIWLPEAGIEPGRLHLNWVRTSKCSRILFQVGVRHREMYERWHVDGEFNLSRRLRA